MLNKKSHKNKYLKYFVVHFVGFKNETFYFLSQEYIHMNSLLLQNDPMMNWPWKIIVANWKLEILHSWHMLHFKGKESGLWFDEKRMNKNCEWWKTWEKMLGRRGKKTVDLSSLWAHLSWFWVYVVACMSILQKWFVVKNLALCIIVGNKDGVY